MKTFVQIYKYKKGTNEPMRYRVATYSTKKNASNDIRANGYVVCAVLSINELKEIYAQTNGVYFDSYESYLIGQELCKKMGLRSYTNDNAQRIVSFFNDCVFYDNSIMELLNPTQEQEQPTQEQSCGVVSCEHGMTKQYMSEKAHKVANEFNKAIVKLETLLNNANTPDYDLTETCELNLKLMRKTQKELKDTLAYFTMNNKKATMEYHYDCIEYFEWLLNEKYLPNIKGIENALKEQPTQEQSCGVVSCEQPTQEPQTTLENLSSDLREQYQDLIVSYVENDKFCLVEPLDNLRIGGYMENDGITLFVHQLNGKNVECLKAITIEKNMQSSEREKLINKFKHFINIRLSNNTYDFSFNDSEPTETGAKNSEPVPTEKTFSHNEYVKMSKPFTKYELNKMTFEKNNHRKKVKDTYTGIKGSMAILFDSDMAIYENTLEKKLKFLKDCVERYKKEYQAIILSGKNNTEYLEKAYVVTVDILATQNVINELMGCKHSTPME